LGLAIVDRLVRELRGTLSISNHPAGGLLVKISVPIREATIRDS
jgi:signal transduction histidine kinase